MKKCYLYLILTITISGQYLLAQIFDGNLNSWYNKQFAKADSLVLEGLPHDAGPVYDLIFERAMSEKNHVIQLRVINERMVNKCYYEEKALFKVIEQLEADIEILEFPVDQVAHSILGNLYWQYYRQNRWRINQRTSLSGDAGDDIETWDLKRIVQEVINQHNLSLQNPGKLFDTPVDIFDQMLQRKYSGRQWRPTVLDLLAHKALDIYKNSEASLVKPVDRFFVYDPVYFSPANKFSSYNISSDDTSSLSYNAVKLYQLLTRFHLNDSNEHALVDLELNRLKYVHDISTNPLKDTLYRESLKTLAEQTNNTELKLEVLYRLANFIYSLESGGTTNYYKQALEICNRVIKDYPAHGMRSYFNSIIDKINEPALFIESERLISPNKTSLVKLNYKNINAAYFKVYRVDLRWMENRHDFNRSDISTYKNLKYIAEWKQELPNIGDYRQHKVEVPVKGLDKGFYVIVVSDRKGLDNNSNTNATIINVTNLFLLNRPPTEGQSLFTVCERESGIPRESVSIALFNYKYDYKTRANKRHSLGKIVTNENGEAIYKGGTRSFSLIVSSGGDTLFIPRAYSSRYYNQNRWQSKTVLYTDRGVYRPGQTVFFKGLMLECFEDTCSILPDMDNEVVLYDPNRQVISEIEVESNEFGTFSGSFTIPTGLLNGVFTLRCDYGEKQIRVEEYKRPTFEINYNLVAETYSFNDSVRIKGTAKAYAGYPIDNAKITYRITRKAESRWSWYWWPVMDEEKQVAVGKAFTDKEGNFTITYYTDDRDIKDKDQIYTYTLVADITDANGETRSAKHSLRISNSPLIISTELPDVIFTNSIPEIKIQTSNINGGEVNADIQISVNKLSSPGTIIFERPWDAPDVFVLDEKNFRKDFPNRVYNTETNPGTWPEGKVVFNDEFNTSMTNTKLQKSLSALQQGYYKVKISAKDSSNQEATWEKVVQVIQSEPQMPVCAKDWVIPVKKSGEPGETAEFWIASLTPNTPIRYELLHGDELVETKIIAPGTNVERIQIPILEKYRGGFAVQFVQVAAGQAFISLQEVTVPYTNKKLDVSFISYRNKLLPGEQEQWKLSIKNNRGEKETAEMLATLYDASLDIFAPLSWETYFIQDKNHGWHRWNNRLIPRLSDKRSLARTSYSIRGWYKNYERLKLSYSYYGGYNSHYRDFQYRLRQKKQNKEREAKAQATYKNIVAINDSLLNLLKKDEVELVGETGKVNGIITSGSDNEALPGATINVINSSTRTVSNIDGKFTLDKLPKGIWLQVSFVGYQTQYVQVLTNSVSIVMVEDIQELEEVVAAGYGTRKKMQVTNSVAMSDDVEFFEFDVGSAPEEEIADTPLEQAETRKNFNETAFFYPHLLTDDNGEITVEFTIPEALTRWKMKGFAHTKDFKTGAVSNTLVTQKHVAIMVNAPRFLREDDTIELAAKVSNLSDKDISGHALIQLFDALTNEPIDSQLLQSEAKIPFTIKKGQSTGLRWKLKIPSGIQAVNYKVMAKAGQHVDGEENILPVLVNSKLVTESLPFMLRPNETSEYRFDKMVDQKSATLRNENYIIEFTSNPVWYAIQAMPYLMEYPYECSEQVFSRFFANSLSTTIMNSSPRIKNIFEIWKASESVSLVSNLEKNQELKELLIQETPWLRNAENETERKKRLGLLFDLNHMANNINSAFTKLQKKQTPNGGFAWFDGMPDNRYITQHIAIGLAQLQHLGAIRPNNEHEVESMLQKAVKYLDERIVEDYNRLLEQASKGFIEMENDHLSVMHIHYLYCKSFNAPVKPNKKLQEAYNYFYNQAKTYWLLKSEFAQGMISIALNRSNDNIVSGKIIKSLSNRAIRSKELGMYWADNHYGYYWYQAPIETQAMLIEAFNEITNDTNSIEEMKIWLLRNKQTTDWKTTKATVAACYALLLRGLDHISETKLLNIEVAGKPLESLKDFTADAGTGYVKTSFKGNEIKPVMGEIKVHNPNKGLAWGSAYWQYFEKLDKITSAETNLKIVKKLYVKENTSSGPTLNEITRNEPINVGDEVVVRVEIRADRDYEYVHLKDMRAAGFEPISTVSEYKYRDGLGYYESVKDASENFFIGYMRKGVYVFEYSLRATHAGVFSNGITTMQCMYAPEFSSHSEGIRVEIRK